MGLHNLHFIGLSLIQNSFEFLNTALCSTHYSCFLYLYFFPFNKNLYQVIYNLSVTILKPFKCLLDNSGINKIKKIGKKFRKKIKHQSKIPFNNVHEKFGQRLQVDQVSEENNTKIVSY